MKKLLAAFLVVLIFTFPAWGLELVRQKSADTVVVFPLIDEADNVSLIPAVSPSCQYAGWTDAAVPTGFSSTGAEAQELGSGFYYVAVESTEIATDYLLLLCTAAGALDQSILIRTMTVDPWLTDLPGAYSGSDAGYIVGALLARDATLLGSLSPGVLQAAITAEPGTPLRIRRGDVTTLTFNLDRDLTGKKVYFTAKADPADDNADAVILGECTVTDAAAGVATYTTSTSETAAEGSYYFDVEVREADDSSPATAIYGRLQILSDVHQ